MDTIATWISAASDSATACIALYAALLAKDWRAQRHAEKVAAVAAEVCVSAYPLLEHLKWLTRPVTARFTRADHSHVDEAERLEWQRIELKVAVESEMNDAVRIVDRFEAATVAAHVYLEPPDYAVANDIKALYHRLYATWSSYLSPDVFGSKEPGVRTPMTDANRQTIDALRVQVVELSKKARYRG